MAPPCPLGKPRHSDDVTDGGILKRQGTEGTEGTGSSESLRTFCDICKCACDFHTIIKKYSIEKRLIFSEEKCGSNR